jgi:signal transduction histidine kinase
MQMTLDMHNLECLQEMPALNASQIGETRLLLEAFEMFTQASSSLESAFSQLQRRVQRLTEELESKNIQLENSLKEKEEVQNYLKTILARLPCGVFALDKEGNPALSNPVASEVLGTRNGRLVLSPAIQEHFANSISSGESEIPIVNGNKIRILATSGAPLIDAEGRETGTLHIIRDITEMKSLQEKSKRIERLSAMGEMAVELAHEIRNPLGGVELFASLLVKELTGDPKRWAENIRVGIRSLNSIVTNMLHFANPIEPSFSEVNIHEVAQDILKFTDPIMSQRKVRVEQRFEAENSILAGDRELLSQMMLNLILNAMKAMPENGSLTIATRNFSHKRRGRQALELQISDTGIGIPPENLDRIFDPFFTTNKNGTGLGLSVVHQIVERHSGAIRVASEVNRGTTFTIVFSGNQNGAALFSKDSVNE